MAKYRPKLTNWANKCQENMCFYVVNMQVRINHKRTKKSCKYWKITHESGKWSNSQSWDLKVNFSPPSIQDLQDQSLEDIFEKVTFWALEVLENYINGPWILLSKICNTNTKAQNIILANPHIPLSKAHHLTKPNTPNTRPIQSMVKTHTLWSIYKSRSMK